jgi:hypothetical protein
MFDFFLDFQYLTTEFGLAKEFLDNNRNGFFLYFQFFLRGNEIWAKKEGQSL